jgi:hypothetical protein
MSQEDILATVDRLSGMPAIEEEKLTTAEAKLYQVRVADIERLTGLDFGPMAAGDTKAFEGIDVARPRIVRMLEDIKLV